MNAPLADVAKAKRIDALLREVAVKKGLEQLHLADFLDIPATHEAAAWKRALEKADVKYANLTDLPESIPGVKLCQILKSEFATEAGWRGVLNRLGQMYAASYVRGFAKIYAGNEGPESRRESASQIRGLIAQVRKIIGAPDAQALVLNLVKDAGVRLDEFDADLSRSADDAKALARRKQLEAERAKAEEAAARAEQERLEREARAALARAAAERMRKEQERRRRDEQATLEREEQERRRNAEIQPGNWLITRSHPVLPQLAQFTLDLMLDQCGSCNGAGAMNLMGFPVTMNYSGTWEYDYRERVLNLHLTQAIDSIGGFEAFLPPEARGMLLGGGTDRLTIISGSNGRYAAQDQQGHQCRIERGRRR